MDEFSRIATYFAPLATAKGALGLTDDAAYLTVPAGEQLVITVDTLVEGIHFAGDEPAPKIAQKALRVNLSDLAAKGATPLGYFLSLSLPTTCDEHWIADFCQGLAHDQKTYSLSLLGGDSTASKQGVVISITAIGSTGHMVRRSGAQVGDVLFVTGTIGDAALGLKAAQDELADAFLLSRYHLPQPRVAFADAIRTHATAALDVSDGLLQDASHLAKQSAVALEIALDALPLSQQAIAYGDNCEARLALATGGDDYEILFTAPSASTEALTAAAVDAGIALTAIGQCKHGAELQLSYAQKPVPLPAPLGYTHSS